MGTASGRTVRKGHSHDAPLSRSCTPRPVLPVTASASGSMARMDFCQGQRGLPRWRGCLPEDRHVFGYSRSNLRHPSSGNAVTDSIADGLVHGVVS
jgi:hypothetical protein